MFDIHHHLLWGLDDGAKDFETAVAMARLAAADGITHVVCTPHSNGQYSYQPELNREKIAQLSARLAAENIPLTLGIGCDFHVSYDNLQAAKTDPTRFSINGLGYLLIELPDYAIPSGLGEILYELQVAGLTPILTHPERNPSLLANSSKLAEWIRAGLLIQVTADSVLGHMGKRSERMAHQLLSKRWVHFLATDAHNTESRPPRMSEAAALVARKYGEAYARSLVDANPRAAFEGNPLRPAAEPIDLYEALRPPTLWQRIFGR
jgi:protein-tyrosine phosphatase